MEEKSFHQWSQDFTYEVDMFSLTFNKDLQSRLNNFNGDTLAIYKIVNIVHEYFAPQVKEHRTEIPENDFIDFVKEYIFITDKVRDLNAKIFNRQWQHQNDLPGLRKSIEESYTKIQNNYIATNIFALKNQFNETNQIKKNIEEQIKEHRESVTKSLLETKFDSFAKNLNSIRKSNKTKIILTSIALCIFIGLLICSISTSTEEIQSVFDKASQKLYLDSGLSILYVLKHSIPKIALVSLLYFLILTCVKLLKSFIHLQTIYEYKIPLLSNFRSILGEHIFNDNPKEREIVISKLMDSILSLESTGIIENNSDQSKDNISLNNLISALSSSKGNQ